MAKFKLRPMRIGSEKIFAISAVLLVSPYAFSEEDVNTQSGSTLLDELRIEGQQIEQTKQSTLSSTTKLTGETIDDLGLQDLRESLRIQANTYVAPSNNGNNGISIRGINSEGVGEPGANSRPLTTLVIDGAAQSIEGVRRGQRGTWDLESIEVTRGPQSTLQGRNTMAGSIAVKTKDPTDYWEAAARLSVGELGLFAPAMMVSGPLSDEFSFRIAAETSESEKDIEYSASEAEFLREDEYRNVRGKLLYSSSNMPLEMLLTLSDTLDDPAVQAVSGESYGYDYRDRFYDVQATAAEKRRNEVRNHVFTIKYDLGGGSRLESTTAFVETDAIIIGLGSDGSQDYFRDELRADNDITQLLRWIYQPRHSNIEGEFGIFAGRFENDRDSLVKIGNNVQQDIASNRQDINTAIFGELWWDFMPGWRLVSGARYEMETTDQVTDNRYDGVRETSDYENSVFLPKVGVLNELNDSDTLAFTISSGYRGGFREVGATSSGDELGRTVDPEYLTNFELAYRSLWLDSDLQLDVSLFYNYWEDQQVSVNSGGDSESSSVFNTTLNAGKAHSSGIEVDVSWQALDVLQVGASIGYLQTRFDEFDVGEDELIHLQRVEGNEFPEAPRFSGGLWAISRFADYWFISSSVSARSKAFATSDIYNNDEKVIPGYAIVGLRGGYESQSYSAVVSIDNLFDREYLIGRDRLDGYYVGDGRNASVTLTAHY
ncbi:MAG: TonB-dependent receptor [Pseudomonadales bacterium]|nr:TonB-dependent receptor [Pseudomonadales bacterium]